MKIIDLIKIRWQNWLLLTLFVDSANLREVDVSQLMNVYSNLARAMGQMMS